MSLQKMISFQVADTLEDFCKNANNVCTQRTSRGLAPGYIIQQYNFLVDSSREWLNGYGAIYSQLFLHELATQSLDNSCELMPALFSKWLYNKIHPYDVFNIYDEISILEWNDIPKDMPVEKRPLAYRSDPPHIRKSITRKASEFKQYPLKGFWHKHHTQAGFIATNIFLQHNKAEEVSRIAQLSEVAFPNNPNDEEAWGEYLNLMAHECTVGTYEERLKGGRTTGEWIVYARHEGRNHYLTLATHSEPDIAILRRIALCRDDFPFLNDYPQFRER